MSDKITVFTRRLLRHEGIKVGSRQREHDSETATVDGRLWEGGGRCRRERMQYLTANLASMRCVMRLIMPQRSRQTSGFAPESHIESHVGNTVAVLYTDLLQYLYSYYY